MTLQGQSLIGQRTIASEESGFQAINPSNNQALSPHYGEATSAMVSEACRLAFDAFDPYRSTSLDRRAAFLETIAEEIEALGEVLIERAMAESGLPQPRLEGERGRTCGQLRHFAEVVREGSWQGFRHDSALPDRQPLPRPDLRQRQIGVGPVAVFGASNFPLAFSVAGGDTASALAAGCPVVVKAHPAHPGTSELVGRAIQKAIAKHQLPEGVFSLLFGATNELGKKLVMHPQIQAVAFTGSRAGGLALTHLVQSRPQPIPIYAEMSSINPVFLLPGSLAGDTQALAEGYVGSLTLGAGQFCTNPGLVFGLQGENLNAFARHAANKVADSNAQTMLTPKIAEMYSLGVTDRNEHCTTLALGQPCETPNQGQAALYRTDATHFINNPNLHEELFGAASLLVECDSLEQMRTLAEELEGQLTATLCMDESDLEAAKTLLPTLERRAGRILVNGWPTGVEVAHAMVHGGPFPATSDARTTSVGSAAIVRFLRPVCYQGFPTDLLPVAFHDGW